MGILWKGDCDFWHIHQISRLRNKFLAPLQATFELVMEEGSNKRFRPQDWVIGLGIAVAVFTALSGVAAAVFDQHGNHSIHREVFGNIPTAAKVAFYTIIPALIIYGAWNFSLRVRNWTRGQPDNRSTTTKNVHRRAQALRAGLYMKTLMRDPAAGLMH